MAALTAAGAAVLVVIGLARVRAGDDPPPAGAPAPTTTAPYRLERLAHRPGDCVSWDLRATAGPTRAITTVPCDRDHLLEITGHAVIDEELDHEPTDDELDAITARLCRPVDEAHLGGRLDPHGRYYSAGIQPSVEGWRDGDREVWCGLGARDGTEGDGTPARRRPFRGRVTVASQFWRYDRGTCLVAGRRAGVACSADHEVEVVGRVELDGGTDLPPLDDAAGWEALVGPGCRDQARAYLGHDPGAPLTVGWLGIAADSWAAGARTAHCVVGEQGAAGNWVTVRSSVRSVAI